MSERDDADLTTPTPAPVSDEEVLDAVRPGWRADLERQEREALDAGCETGEVAAAIRRSTAAMAREARATLAAMTAKAEGETATERPSMAEETKAHDPHHGGVPEWRFEGGKFFQRPGPTAQWVEVKRVSLTPARVRMLAALCTPTPAWPASGEEMRNAAASVVRMARIRSEGKPVGMKDGRWQGTTEHITDYLLANGFTFGSTEIARLTRELEEAQQIIERRGRDLEALSQMHREDVAAARAEVARLTGELEELVDAGARAAEEGFKIAARLTARVEEAEARAARAARELAEARGRENHALARLDAARTEAARLREALAETRKDYDEACAAIKGLEDNVRHYSAANDAATARAEKYREALEEAKAEVTRLREAGKQFAEEIEHGCLACCGDGCEGAHVDDTREAIATFRRVLGGGA